jgi:hypothetical protein
MTSLEGAVASSVPTESITQTRVFPDLVKALKMHALEQDRLLKDVCAEAIGAFLEHRDQATAQSRPKPPVYLVSPRTGIEFNLRIPAPLLKRVRRVADDDQTHARRVLYTALVRYAEKNKLLGK